ncbi:MAG: 6-carboxytetrahydropterin synthase QueD [Elusimicrobia bacterium]|nr:6-carboxytetrahydropterin synthase QueD [Elusimicrobiota bacterium]
MYSVMVEDGFSAAHNLRNYKGKCEKLHGHNYRVRLTVKGETLDKSGMLIDFTVLKNILENVLSKFDHGYLNDISPFDKINPTAENIAEQISKQIQFKIKKSKFKIKVSVWETEKNCATYYEAVVK